VGVLVLLSLVAEFATAQKCRGEPDPPEFATVRCFKKRGVCRATCLQGYIFSEKNARMALYDCEGGDWVMKEGEDKCVPECDPPCENGVCIDPNACDCFLGFTGDYCEEEEEEKEEIAEPDYDSDEDYGSYSYSSEEDDESTDPLPATYQVGNWSQIRDACIEGANYKTLSGVLSIGLCKEHCLFELGNNCGSIDYEPDSGNCFISEARSDHADYTEPCADGVLTKFTELLPVTIDVNWSPIRDACIQGNNYKTLSGVLSIGLCKEHCVGELGNMCGSIDYEPESGKCFISEARSDSYDYTEPCFDGVVTKFMEILLQDTTVVNWSPLRDACIKENNYKTLSGVLSIGLCKEHCLFELGNNCGSIDYEQESGKCFISEARSDSDDYTEPCFDGVATKFTEIPQDTTDVNWSPIRDACIEGNNYKNLSGVLSIVKCKEHCLFELGNNCGSIDYEPDSGNCFISEARSDSDDYTEPCFDGVVTKFTEIRQHTTGSQTSITGGVLVGACLLSIFAAGTHYFIKRQ